MICKCIYKNVHLSMIFKASLLAFRKIATNDEKKFWCILYENPTAFNLYAFLLA